MGTTPGNQPVENAPKSQLTQKIETARTDLADVTCQRVSKGVNATPPDGSTFGLRKCSPARDDHKRKVGKHGKDAQQPNGFKLSDRGWRSKTWSARKSRLPASVRWSALLCSGRGVVVTRMDAPRAASNALRRATHRARRRFSRIRKPQLIPTRRPRSVSESRPERLACYVFCYSAL